jgi:hypothetical protein
MILVGSTVVSQELFEEFFACDLAACKGACCIEGDGGAPLEESELIELENAWEFVKPYMRQEGIEEIQKNGLYQVDADGDHVTTLIHGHAECAFVVFDEKGIAKCAIEQAYLDGAITWQKPISCHLYPVRLGKLRDYVAVNYHRWGICAPACACGASLKLPLFRFLKAPLIRRFGDDWFREMEDIEVALNEEKGSSQKSVG